MYADLIACSEQLLAPPHRRRPELVFVRQGSRREIPIRHSAAVLAALWFLAIATAWAAPGDALYAHPGRLIDAGHGVHLNFYCMGTGSPTVIFDAGWEDWSPSWALIQPAISRTTRTCAYDRAGNGFSSAGPLPRTSMEIARELHAALHNGHIPGPYLLVGHSFGSYNMRAFADMYMPEVYGLVLVDGESGDLPGLGDDASDRAEEAAALANLSACRAAIAAHKPLPPLTSQGHSVSPGAAPAKPCSEQFFRSLPMPEWSPELNAAVLRIASTRLGLYTAVISEMREMPTDVVFLQARRRLFGNRPIRVLTAQNHWYDTAKTPAAEHAKHMAFEAKWAAGQRQYLSLSTNSKQILATKSGHYIQLDQPYLVIDAIQSELQR